MVELGPQEPAGDMPQDAAKRAAAMASTAPLGNVKVAGSLREGPGTRIGPYKILQLIGEGGFGSVFLAEQSVPFHRKVALKIIKLGMDTRQVVARFEQERQALAILDHPGIAKVFDAGATDTGRPYFVMELVKGEPLVEYCDRQSLSVPERLELFIEVCGAVQHAHGKGIIHRDIKPGNILVSTLDGHPYPKVIDFGIAKATSARLTDKTLFTEFRQLIGTPEYMSPEQADGSLDIDTRTDVYALGVTLYELLTGTTPFDSKSLRSAAYGEMQRIIREVDPPRPSTRLSESASTLPSIAARRKTDPERLGRTLRGELDWIVMKSLEKDRARRYATAEALAADVRRYLAGEAVLAAPPSRVYQARKFVRRNRGVVAAASAIFVALVTGLGGTLWQASAARAESRRADERARAAEEARKQSDAVVAFMQDTMIESDPFRGGSQGVTVLQAMEEALKSIEAGALKDQPVAEAQLRFTIAEVMNANGRSVEAAHVGEPALATFREAHPEGDVNLARALLTQARNLDGAERMDEALALYREARAMFERFNGRVNDETVMALNGIGSCLRSAGRYDEALSAYREGLESLRQLGPGFDEAIANALGKIAALLELLGRSEEALELFNESLEISRTLFPGDSPQVAESIGGVAATLDSLGRYDEALALQREAMAMEDRLYAGDHPRKAASMNNIASTLQSLRRFEESLDYHRRALDMRRRLFPGDHPEIASSISNVALALDGVGREEDGIPMLEESLAMRRRLFEDDHPQLVIGLFNLAMGYRNLGRVAEALPIAIEAVEMAQRLYDEDHPMRLRCEKNVAALKEKMGGG